MKCSHKDCDADAEYFGTTSRYCVLHHRIVQMKSDARKRGLSVPTTEELEYLFLKLDGMKCPVCGRAMTYHRIKGMGGQVVTLQHDDSGEYKLLCLACNIKHAQYGGDDWYDLTDGYYKCITCQEIKPFSEFYKRTDNSNQIYTRCKICECARKRTKPMEEPTK